MTGTQLIQDHTDETNEGSFPQITRTVMTMHSKSSAGYQV